MLGKPSGLSDLGAQRPVQMILGLLLLLLPTVAVRPLANALGHSIGPGARIGFSLVLCRHLALAPGVRIGHFNLLRVDRILLRSQACIRHMNICRGPMDLILGERADLGNRNTLARAARGMTFGTARLWLGQGAKVTAGHALDCTRSIRIGAWSTLAGKGSQIWTHGYVHEAVPPKRYRVDGGVTIGSNVYIGSGVIITGGVSICDNATVGVGTSVTKHLREPGFYVSGPLRMLPLPPAPETRKDMVCIEDPGLVETVYRKHNARP